MIVSECVKLELSVPFDNSDIESALIKRGIDPLRWAVTEADNGYVVLNVSYVKEN